MQGYSTEKVINTILDDKRLKTFKLFAESQVGSNINVFKENSDRCYSSGPSWYSKATKIALGTQFYPKAFFGSPKVIPVTDIRDMYKHIASTYYGTFYHEMFHLKWTPFGAVSDYVSKYDDNFQCFAFQVSNILEDITIEKTGAYEYPACIPFLKITSSIFSQKEYLDLQEKAIHEKPDHPETLLSYLLLHCREIDLSTLSSYKLWEENKKFIEDGAYLCIHTKIADTRAKRQVAYAIQLYKMLCGEEPNIQDVKDNNVDEPVPGGTPGGTPIDGTTPGGSILKQTYGRPGANQNNNTAERQWNQPKTEPQPCEIPYESEMKEIENATQASHGSGSGSVPDIITDLTTSGITTLASDEPIINQPHWSADLSDYIDTLKFLDNYMEVVAKHEKEIRQVVAQIKKMKALNNRECQHYKMKGRLDMSTIYKKDNYKIFKKKNAPKEEAELVFEILVDNSGSMRGNKARLAGEALIIFCEALNRLHIPFSVDCFTEGSESITISLKHYNQLYNKVKTNMTLFTEQFNVNELSTWCGNVDEANVRCVAHELMEQSQKDKVLLIISDGATCGSKTVLKQLAESIEKTGITVLGIGIYDHEVEDIYSKHMIVSKSEDLEKLGAFLNRYLVKLIFKGGNK